MATDKVYLPGDSVYYTGEKFKDRLNGKRGWIHARIEGVPGGYVVEFPDTRNVKDPEDSDDYVMSVKVLSEWRPPHSEKKHEGPEIQPRRRHRSTEEE